MEIKVIISEKYTTLAPIGELDASSSHLMDEKINIEIDKDSANLHIDCSGLEYISSAGLGVFISFMETLKEKDGKFVFSGMSTNTYNVFELLGLNQVMTIVPTEEEAKKEFSA